MWNDLFWQSRRRAGGGGDDAAHAVCDFLVYWRCEMALALRAAATQNTKRPTPLVTTLLNVSIAF